MKYKELFNSPLRTVELINIQANDPENINFAKKYFPPFSNGAEIWDKVKPLTQFKADPLTVDTIQGIATLFNNHKNIHGVSGQGDCDCFVSSLASIAIANKLPFQYIIQGNNKPSHIAIIIDGTIIDLTNPIPDYLRQYNFTKYIKPMYVALADDNEVAMEADFGRPNLRRTVNTLKNARPKQIVRQLTAAQKAKILMAKRHFKKCGFGDSEAALLAMDTTSYGAGGRGRAKVMGAVKKYGKFVLPVAGVAASLLVPGVGGKVVAVANKTLQKIGGAQTLTAGKKLLQSLKPSAAPSELATLPMLPNTSMQTMAITPSEPTFSPDTYVTATVPISAPKINPLYLLAGGAVALYLFTRKK